MGKLIYINSGKFGIGTSSLILSIIAIMFSFTSLGEKTIGQEILGVIGIRFPVMIISAIIFVFAMFIGHIYRENYGAKMGRNISIFFIILMATLSTLKAVN